MNIEGPIPMLDSVKGFRSKRPWTQKEEALLIELKHTHTCEQIGKMIRRSRRSVGGHYLWMKIKKRQEVLYTGIDRVIMAYTAGIVDGEGHISIARTRKYFTARVEVCSTSSKLTDFLRQHFGGSQYIGKRPNRKPYYRWLIAANQAEQFLRVLRDYLVIKTDQADLAIRFREEYDHTKHEGMFNRMKALHKYD